MILNHTLDACFMLAPVVIAAIYEQRMTQNERELTFYRELDPDAAQIYRTVGRAERLYRRVSLHAWKVSAARFLYRYGVGLGIAAFGLALIAGGVALATG